YRRLIESLIARTAAQRADDDDRAAIRAALSAFEASANRRTPRRHDTELHLVIAHTTHNARLVRLHQLLLSEVSLGVSEEPYTWEIYEEAKPHHRALAEAVIGGDQEG